MKQRSPKLDALGVRRDKRVRKREHHYAAWKRFRFQKKRGKAQWHKTRYYRQIRAIKKLDRLILRERTRIREQYLSGPWGGSEAVLVYEVEPCVAKHRGSGLVTSGKRSETFGNPGSDHYVGNTTASARDFALNNDQEMAHTLFGALTGQDRGAWGGDYSSFYIDRYGVSFRVQIIAGTHGTGPHLHCGVKRA